MSSLGISSLVTISDLMFKAHQLVSAFVIDNTQNFRVLK